jgi:hypothetical protein
LGQQLSVECRATWLLGRVLGVDGDAVLVHYCGYSDHYDEWVNAVRDASRLRPWNECFGWEEVEEVETRVIASGRLITDALSRAGGCVERAVNDLLGRGTQAR